MDSPSLSVPQQHNYTDPTVERDIGRLREWLINLPLMDVVETVRLVLGALTALNEQKLDEQLRFDCLEVYRATVIRLFHTLDPLYLRQLSLSKAQRQEAIDGTNQLFVCLAGGYKLIVLARRAAADTEAGDPLFGQSLNRALESLSYTLLDCYRFYRDVPPMLIVESHVLYRLARHSGLLALSVHTGDDLPPAPATGSLYHASMMLALTEPERLAEGEVGLLFDVLVQHADKCRIIPGNSWEGDGEGLYLIDLRTGNPPEFCTRLSSPAIAQEPYLLDATRALQAIRRQLEQTPEKVRMQSPEAMVLRRLLPEHGGDRQRRELRHREDGQVSVITGLEAIHAWLRTHRELTPGAVNALPRSRLLDRSENGMKLSLNDGGAGDVRVGELLGVVEGDNNRYVLRLAIVRSIRVFREGGLEAGLLLLDGGFGAVTCILPENPDQDAVHALFMPAVEQEQVAATLLAPKGLYAEGRPLLIDVGGREVRVRAGRRVVDTPVFDRFEFAAQAAADGER